MTGEKHRRRTGAHGTKRSGVTRRDALKASSAIAIGAMAGTMGFPAIVRSAQAKKYLKPLVAGLNAKEGDPTFISISLIPKILREKYDVELDIQTHPASTLGTDQSQLEAVQTGFIDITSHSSSQFGQFTDTWRFMDLPYIFTDWDMALRFYKSDLFLQQAAQMESKMPVKVLPAVGAGGYRILWNSKRQVRTPDEVNGLKFRTAKSPVIIEMVKNWGGNPTPIAWSETYTAIQQGVVDGFHVQPIWTFLFNFHEVLKHGTEVRAIFATQMAVININSWNSMPESIQKPFMLAAKEAAEIANQKDRELEGFYRQKLIDAGMVVYTPPPADFKKWQTKGMEVWANSGVDGGLIKKLQSFAS